MWTLYYNFYCGTQKYNLNPWSQEHAYIQIHMLDFIIALRGRMGFTLQNFVLPTEFCSAYRILQINLLYNLMLLYKLEKMKRYTI